MFTLFEVFTLLCTFLVVFQILKVILGFLYEHVISYCVSPVIDFKDQGKWALVTGATDGIGKAFAEALAAKKINVILISRSLIKLKNVAEDIEKKYNVETKTIEADFSKVAETYEHIEKSIYGYEIGILVNNVGLSYPHPEYFLDLAQKDIVFSSIINCNIFSVTNMCKIVMPAMVERKKGIIINMSSTTSSIPSPMLTVYAATKAYIEKFSTDLAMEYAKDGIVLQCLLPGYVATKMSKIRKSTWMAPSPKDYVENALQSIGVQPKSTGYYPHTILVNVINLIQYFSPKFATFIIMQVMENLRRRAIRKQIM